MSRPTLTSIENGQEAWDVDINDNNDVMVNAPFPMVEVADIATLISAFPPASFDRCLAVVIDTGIMYLSSGAAWIAVEMQVQATETSLGVAELATTAEVTAGSDDLRIVTPLKLQQKVNALLGGIDIKEAVETSTFGVGNISLTGEQTLNGLLTSTSRVLVTDQTAPAENGIYVTAAGAWARAADADEDAEVTNGNLTHVTNSGSNVFKRKYLLTTADPITVGTTGQTWEEHDDVDNAVIIHSNVAAEITVITEKTAPIAADELLMEDSAAADVKKSVKLGNLPRQDNVNFVTAQVTAGGYVTPAGGRFCFSGTTLVGAPRTLSIVGGIVGITTAAFRVFDVTNSLQIAELLLDATAAPAIIDLGAIGNLPTGPAVWEVQFQRDGAGGGGDRAQISAVTIQF